jgi:hypothetical protein
MGDAMPDDCTFHTAKIAVLETRLDGIEEKLGEILTHVRATNGRVGKLERWRSYLTGGVAFTLTAVAGAFALLKVAIQ